MPYIPKEDRPQYDVRVDELAEELRSLGSNDAMVGPLSRIVSALAWPLVKQAFPLLGKPPSYGPGDTLRPILVIDLTEKLVPLNNDARVGAFNYIVSRLTWQLCGHGGGERRYARMNMVVGALDCVRSELKRSFAGIGGFSTDAYACLCAVVGALGSAKSELERRIVAPYEDEKIEESGDVEIRPGD